jgi:hypothetical protein
LPFDASRGHEHLKGFTMLRRVTTLGLAVLMLTAAMGCRSSCGQRRGLFGLCSNKDNCDGMLMGYSGKPGSSECFGEPVPGQLMSFPGSGGVPLQPQMGPALPNELPMPQPSELIPGQRVPFAPPGPAPAPLDTSMTSQDKKLTNR